MAGFLFLVWIVLWVAALVDAVLADSTRIRVMPKVLWLIVIVLLSGFAAIAWFIFGRPKGDGTAGSGPSNLAARFGHPSAQRPRPTRTGRTAADDGAGTGWTLGGAGGRRRSGPVAPDDDPDFLRSLGRRRPDESGGTGGTGGPSGGKPDQPA